ncbi:MAG: type II toxin-antitoxin system Phd/YefM family antitoxin [Alphaproteobacteria bacterium]
MRTMAAGRFKDVCLETLDDVARTRIPVVITKRGRPVASVVPFTPPSTAVGLEGSIIAESGDPYSTGEAWGDDPS